MDATVNKAMATSYRGGATTFEAWTAKGSNTDFKPKKIYQISEAGDLKEVKQNGEIEYDEMKDTGAISVLATFGKKFGFSRQAMINDDMDMLVKVPMAYVKAARRGVNKAVYSILTGNPVLDDGQALFSAAHKNIDSSGVYPNTKAYNAAQAAMMKQKNLRGIETLNIRPAFVLCGPELFAAHSSMLRSIADPSSANSGKVNPFQNAMQLIVDAELSPASGNCPYYFAASPEDCETILVCYLNGNENPILESRVGFDSAGIEYRILHDRGISLIDYRGLYKNVGAAEPV